MAAGLALSRKERRFEWNNGGLADITTVSEAAPQYRNLYNEINLRCASCTCACCGLAYPALLSLSNKLFFSVKFRQL
jgi:hypothetical protein